MGSRLGRDGDDFMATQTVTTLIDDKDGSQATETFFFSYQGVEYRIDLSDRNAAAFRKDLEKWSSFASRVGRVRAAAAKPAAPTARREELAAIREWANSNGWPVSPRGRIPANVVEAYEIANG